MSSPEFKSYYEIITPRLKVRSAVDEDAEAVFNILASPENNPHTPVNPELSPEVFRRRIERWTEAASKGESAFMVVELRETGKLIGFGGFNSLPHKPALDGSGEQVLVGDIGIMIDKPHWRKGYARESICAKAEFGFDYFRVGFMSTDTQDDNEEFMALMKSLGLGHLATRRPSWREGEMSWYYEWDKETWEKAKTEMKLEGKWPL